MSERSATEKDTNKVQKKHIALVLASCCRGDEETGAELLLVMLGLSRVRNRCKLSLVSPSSEGGAGGEGGSGDSGGYALFSLSSDSVLFLLRALTASFTQWYRMFFTCSLSS